MECTTQLNQAKSVFCLTGVRNSKETLSTRNGYQDQIWQNRLLASWKDFMKKEKIAFTADVKAIYHQPQVAEDQQSILDFLW